MSVEECCEGRRHFRQCVKNGSLDAARSQESIALCRIPAEGAVVRRAAIVPRLKMALPSMPAEFPLVIGPPGPRKARPDDCRWPPTILGSELAEVIVPV